MKAKSLTILAVAVFVFSSVMMAQAQTENSIWRDEMTYQSADQLQVAGWTITHQAGVSFSGSAIILDGTQEDTAIHYSSHFPSGISNWKVEDRSRWILGSHCGNSVTGITDKHSYTFMADGWYSTFAFYRDGQKTTFGNFQENKNEWFTLSIEKQGNQINMYYNGELKSTYTETDTSSSNLIGVAAVSPWRGGSEYDYFQVWSAGSNVLTPQTSLLSNPIVIGGIIVVIGIGVGGVVYFFVLGGTGAAGSAGGTAGGAGAVPGTGGVGGSGSGAGTASGSAGGGSNLHPTDPVSVAQIDALQSQAQAMHNSAANFMSNPYTAAAGNAINAQATLMDAQALQLQAQNMHNSAANFMSNPYTAAAGNALDSQASAMEAQAAQLQAQAQTLKPPASNAQTTGNSTPDVDSTQGGNTDAQNDSGVDNSGGNTPSDAGEP